MTQEYYSTGRRKFQHLTKEKRAQLEILLKIKPKITKVKIAQILGISRSTLYEELKRGTVEQLDTNLVKHHVYFADAGQRVYEEHRKNSRNPLKLVKAIDFIEYAEREMLKHKWSPDTICGFAAKNHLFEETVCTRTLYNYIDQCLLKVRNIDLPLRVKLKTKVHKDRKNRRIFGDSIEVRPESINNRLEFGHWEIDTIVGTVDTAPVFLTLDERVSRYRIIVKLPNRTSKAVNQALKKILKSYGNKAKSIFKSITADNGSEFAKLNEVSKDIRIFYAHPYSSFERGTNEKQNSLVRRFFPKGSSLKKFLYTPYGVYRIGLTICREKFLITLLHLRYLKILLILCDLSDLILTLGKEIQMWQKILAHSSNRNFHRKI